MVRTQNNLDLSVAIPTLSLDHGVKYYATIYAIDNVGYESSVSSNAMVYDAYPGKPTVTNSLSTGSLLDIFNDVTFGVEFSEPVKNINPTITSNISGNVNFTHSLDGDTTLFINLKAPLRSNDKLQMEIQNFSDLAGNTANFNAEWNVKLLADFDDDGGDHDQVMMVMLNPINILCLPGAVVTRRVRRAVITTDSKCCHAIICSQC